MSAPVSLQPGDVLGERYALDARIDAVAPGDAWAASDRSPATPAARREVLVHVLGPGSAGRDDDPASLAAKVARLRRIRDLNVLPVLDCGSARGRAYVVCARPGGRTLASWLAGHRAAQTRPSLAMAQSIMDRVAIALVAVHTQGLAHGFLTPRAVWVRRMGPVLQQPQVMGAGLWAFLGATRGHALDPAYLAPELVVGDGQPTTRSDVFALAVLWTEMLSSMETPSGDDARMWWQRAGEGPEALQRSLARLRDDVPDAVREVLATALDADPARRHADALTLRTVLRRKWKDAGLSDATLDPAEPEPPEVSLPPRIAEAPSGAAISQRVPESAAPIGWQRAELADRAVRAPRRTVEEHAPPAFAAVATPPAPAPSHDDAPATLPIGAMRFFEAEATVVTALPPPEPEPEAPPPAPTPPPAPAALAEPTTLMTLPEAWPAPAQQTEATLTLEEASRLSASLRADVTTAVSLGEMNVAVSSSLDAVYPAAAQPLLHDVNATMPLLMTSPVAPPRAPPPSPYDETSASDATVRFSRDEVSREWATYRALQIGLAVVIVVIVVTVFALLLRR